MKENAFIVDGKKLCNDWKTCLNKNVLPIKYRDKVCIPVFWAYLKIFVIVENITDEKLSSWVDKEKYNHYF